MTMYYRLCFLSLLFIFLNHLAIGQCANATNIYTFSYNGTTYELVRENKTWIDAASCAVARGGYLAEIDDLAEQNALYNELSTNAGINTNNTIAPDGGGAAYVWIGANDLAIEGNWIWDGDNTAGGPQFWQGTATGSVIGGLFNNWGNEPDNFGNGQDAAGIALTNWPLGVAGQWNDVDHTNALYYLIELNPVFDTIAPIPNSSSLPDIYEECYLISPPIPTATDNLNGTINGTSDLSFPIITEGNYLVTWTFSDPQGNIATQTQNIIIDDTIPPVPSSTSIADHYAQCQADNLPIPTASDNCVNNINGVPDVILPITMFGTTIVTWTYDDGRGNTSTQTQNIIVEDTISPVPDETINDTLHDCIIENLPNITATDNCVGTIVGTHNATLPITTPGTTVVTWSFDDGNGNIYTEQQNVIINPNFDSIIINGINLTAYEDQLTYQWLDCNNNYLPLSDETNQTFTPSENGDYALMISSAECIDTSICITIENLGGLDNNNQMIHSIFPNPTNDGYIIVLVNTNKSFGINIADSQGRVLQSNPNLIEPNQHIQIKGSSGIYYVEIKIEGEISRFFKVVKT